jgi:hypothetical protein
MPYRKQATDFYGASDLLAFSPCPAALYGRGHDFLLFRAAALRLPLRLGGRCGGRSTAALCSISVSEPRQASRKGENASKRVF